MKGILSTVLRSWGIETPRCATLRHNNGLITFAQIDGVVLKDVLEATMRKALIDRNWSSV